MAIDIKAIYNITWEHYQEAKKSLTKKKDIFEIYDSAISDVIPGFVADKLKFGSFDEENFAVLFVDMRRSTDRAKKVGAEKTFLTMHVYLTALLAVVKHYKGKVIDIMGDGLMVFWGGEVARQEENMVKVRAIQHAGLCGKDMLRVRSEVINEIIAKEELGDKISIGVGVTFGSVVVTKIGIRDTYDVKAFGDCINIASKYANNAENLVIVSKKVEEEWPVSKKGKIRFKYDSIRKGYCLYSV